MDPPAVATPKSARKTPKSTRKQLTPGIAKQFACRRQNRLLRSELATVLGRCTQLEKTVADLRSQLEDDREKTLKPTQQQADSSKSGRSSMSASSYEDKPRKRLVLLLTQRSNQALRRDLENLSQPLVYERSLCADHHALENKASILQDKLREALKENKKLKVQLRDTKAYGKKLVKRYKTSMNNLLMKVEDLMKTIERERAILSAGDVFENIQYEI